MPVKFSGTRVALEDENLVSVLVLNFALEAYMQEGLAGVGLRLIERFHGKRNDLLSVKELYPL
jgi:hypothetical protein